MGEGEVVDPFGHGYTRSIIRVHGFHAQIVQGNLHPYFMAEREMGRPQIFTQLSKTRAFYR